MYDVGIQSLSTAHKHEHSIQITIIVSGVELYFLPMVFPTPPPPSERLFLVFVQSV